MSVEDGDWVLVGTIARAHGIKGQVVVNPATDFPAERFAPGRTVRLDDGRTLTIASLRFHQDRPIVGFEGIGSMTDAAALAGRTLHARGGDVTLPASTYFHRDLVGSEVRTVDGALVGKVARVEGPSAASVLVVRGAGREVLIPLAQEICVEIVPAERRIVVAPPEGLLTLNEPDGSRTEGPHGAGGR